MALKVLVTGAGGKTGSVVVRKLLERGTDIFKARAMVRSRGSESKLREQLGPLAEGLEIVLGEVTQPDTLKAACEGVDCLVIVTSAMPKLDKWSLIRTIFLRLFSFGQIGALPSFKYEEGKGPEQVDFEGQVNQIDAAMAAGVKHIVLVSSRGGTRPDHLLNRMAGNILLWKRRAEKYLIASGMQYTILHPGELFSHQLIFKPASGGMRQLFVGVDDAPNDKGQTRWHIPREDLAEVIVNCLTEPAAIGRSFDLGSGEEGEGKLYSGNLAGLLSELGDKNCTYDLPRLPGED